MAACKSAFSLIDEKRGFLRYLFDSCQRLLLLRNRPVSSLINDFHASFRQPGPRSAPVAHDVRRADLHVAALRAMQAAGTLKNANVTVYMTGDEMIKTAKANFDVLFRADPTSVGGAMPGDDLYYTGK